MDGKRLDLMQGILNGVQEQIRFADSKAAFVAVFHTFLFGFIITQAESVADAASDHRNGMFWVRAALLFAYAVTAGFSMIYAILTVIPTLGRTPPECKNFFGHIAQSYPDEHERYVTDACKATESDWLRDIGTQIVENSRIAASKHKRASLAAKWSVGAVALALVLLMTVSMQNDLETAAPTTRPAVQAM